MSPVTISDLLRAQAASRPLEISQYLVLQFLHLQKYIETNTGEKSTDISNTAQLRSEFTMESIMLLEEKKVARQCIIGSYSCFSGLEVHKL